MTGPMSIVILEDEVPARARLVEAMRRVKPDAVIVAAFGAVAQASEWFATNPTPALVLADIQLADGLSFEIFDTAPAACPIIFCTAYDEFAMEAMGAGGIDYLLKPIKDDDLARALAHYDRLAAHFAERVRAVGRAIARPPRRLLARNKTGFVTLAIEQVAYFVVDDKLVDVVTRDGRRFGIDRTLGDLEVELDPREFFRANRQYLVAATAVSGFRPHAKGKLLVDLVPAPPAEVIVSQENATRFRTWLSG